MRGSQLPESGLSCFNKMVYSSIHFPTSGNSLLFLQLYIVGLMRSCISFATGLGPLWEAGQKKFDCVYPTVTGLVFWAVGKKWGYHWVGRHVRKHSLRSWGQLELAPWEPRQSGSQALEHTGSAGSHERAENGVGA